MELLSRKDWPRISAERPHDGLSSLSGVCRPTRIACEPERPSDADLLIARNRFSEKAQKTVVDSL
jgi:hypothetical protein